MLIGAHVSTAGGLEKAIDRAVEIECDAIQIFPQSPRMWRPTNHKPANIDGFNERFAASRVESVTIHAVYLLNTTTPDPEIREKTLTSLVAALRLGDAIAADGVVLHAGSRKGEPLEEALARSGELVQEALRESERCPILFENTAGTQGPLGRDFEELTRLIEVAGGGGRLGACIDCCHLFASGFEIVEPDQLARVVDELDAKVGLNRLKCLHVNDSKVPFGSNRDQHANVGKGEMGTEGIATFLSEPRFEDLPALLETPGPDKSGPDLAEVRETKRLRQQGLSARQS